MSNAATLHTGSVQSVRGAIAGLLALILFGAAALAALSTGSPATGLQPEPASAAEIQRALIDVRAAERASRGAAVPTAEFWAEFRAAEREMR